ncbi:hypothetical protein [Actinokineospora sp. HUAS TT18]|uniref:hypothetical protein n=1 Tax=Actinokineospora sp. HUAS TT18 TaxID=3447451 RepID=UPI003F51FC73
MKKISAILAAAAATIALAAPATAGPEFSFADCPTIPAAADPKAWRCEEMAATGTIRLGRLPTLDAGTLRLTFAEGRLDGKFAQTFGKLRADEIPVPRSHLRLRLEYAGYADFESNDERMGELHLNLAVTGPLIPETCEIGPIRFITQRTAPTEVVTTDPLVVKFAIADNTFTAPNASGCGPFDKMINQRFGLPSQAGESSLRLATRVGIRSYATP